MSNVESIRASCLGNVAHGFFGRRGGVSEGAMWGLNAGYGSGDDQHAIAENRQRVLASTLPGAPIATVHQIHSPNVVYAAEAWSEAERPQADALVTDRPGLLLGILTADCAPILFSEDHAGVIGAAHAGWRGALAGVTDSTIKAMEEQGARRERIKAAIGPCIARASYEVDEQFRQQFIDEDRANERFFSVGAAGKPQFDLPAYLVHRLIAAGIGEVEALHVDTYSQPDRFFSYRRATHSGEPGYGRQISVIGLRG